MPALSLVGPSYQLRNRNADYERTVNYVPVLIESQQGKGGASSFLMQAPGLSTALASLGGEVRGLFVARDVLYAVAGASLYRVASDWTMTLLGSLGSSAGMLDGASNNTQLCIVDGPSGYVYDLDSASFSTLSGNWRGSVRVGVLDGYGCFHDPDTTQFYISGSQDFTLLDALDFASAEGSTGAIVGLIVNRRDLYLLKTNNTEIWYDAGGTDFAFARNDGANIEAGCSAAHTIRKAGGSVFWLGRDERGAAVVFGMAAYSPQRISTHAIEEQLAALSDLSSATAWTYHQEGLTYYVLNVPGLTTTWVYELSSGTWHERAEWVDGAYRTWRATCHAFVYGQHIVGDSSGNLYRLDPTLNTYAGDVMVRSRISPHQASSTLQRRRVGSIQIDCQTGLGKPDGSAGALLLRYSDDGGRTWGNWRALTLGAIGQYKARARATMLGAARDRVWEFRVTDDVRCDLLTAVVDEV